MAGQIYNSYGRIIAVLGGTPRDISGWKIVTDAAAKLLEDNAHQLTQSEALVHHRRAQEPYPAVSWGVSLGGGQPGPSNLQTTAKNTRVTDELLASDCFKRLSGWANLLFWTFAPLLAAFVEAQMTILAESQPSLVWNFVGSVFAACTFNFGPHAITVSHLDFGNLSWGWCAITALGRCNPDLGGHLVLWDLKLIIRFPPGSTILIPSAIIRHSNSPIAIHEF
ncbi:hypothetical protein B0H14DRAFT_3557404 [Mycena olivaceomarginata]|nr:hypothetical protein B0H14DRAFT_3557404 [Mycena olivaceomarginata]